MSETPETDAAADWYLAAAYSTDPEHKTVPVSLSRKLERERDEAREVVKELREIIKIKDQVAIQYQFRAIAAEEGREAAK